MAVMFHTEALQATYMDKEVSSSKSLEQNLIQGG
jgi:hypothetical protein